MREEDDDAANRSNLSDGTRDTDEGDNVSEQGWALVDENRSASSPASPSSSGHHGNRRKHHTSRTPNKKQRLHDDDSIQIISENGPGASRQNATPTKRATNNLSQHNVSLDDSLVTADEMHPLYDDVSYFLLSLAPALRRLPPRKQSLAKINIQTMLHEVEFDN